MLKIITSGLTVLLSAVPIAESKGQAISSGSVQPSGAQAFFPADIDAFIGRRITCNKQGGAAVRDGSQESRNYLRCEDIATDEQSLRQKYRLDQDVIKALDGTWVRVVQRLPVVITDTIPTPPDEKPVGR